MEFDPMISRRIAGQLLTAAALLFGLIGFAVASDLTGFGTHPVAGTIVTIPALGAVLGKYFLWRGTPNEERSTFIAKLIIGLVSFGCIMSGALNLFLVKDPSMSTSFFIAVGAICCVLLIVFHAYTKRLSSQQSA